MSEKPWRPGYPPMPVPKPPPPFDIEEFKRSITTHYRVLAAMEEVAAELLPKVLAEMRERSTDQ